MIIKIELTESILNVLTTAQKDEILRGLITDLKESVDLRIEKIKAELGDTRTAIVTPRGDKIIYTSEENAELIKRVKEDYKNGGGKIIPMEGTIEYIDMSAEITAKPVKLGDTIPLPEKDNGSEVVKISQKIPIKPVIVKKPDFTHANQTLPNHIIEEIQTRYDDGEETLMLIAKDYPEWAYRTIWAHIKLKKKLKK